MSAATAHAAYVLAQAAVRGDALMHLSSQRDTGALNPVCGANPVRSKEIRTWAQSPADLSSLCADCAGLLTAHPYIDSVEDGLAVWLGSTIEAPTVRLLEVPVSSIRVASAIRPADEDLIESVREYGVLQPITARRTTSGLELVMGGRRLSAAIAAELDSIPTLVREVSDEQAILATLTENLHRLDLDPIAQARSYQRALEVLEFTKEALADRLHVSRSLVSNRIRLLGLPGHLQARIVAGDLTAAHGLALLRLENGSDEQAELAERILAEGLSSKDADHAAKAATAAPAAAKLGDVSKVLAASLAAAGLAAPKVRVSTTADRARVVLDVAAADLARVLEQLEQLTA